MVDARLKTDLLVTVRKEDEAFPRVDCPVTVRVDAVVVAKVEVPVTTKVLVVVAFPRIALVKFPSVARRDEKNPFVEVALVVVRLPIVPVVE